MKTVVIVLDNIRSVYNVGSIFRTAEGFGVSKIYLCGTTPQPVDRFGRDRKDMAKVALGAEQTVPWGYFKTTRLVIEKLKQEGFVIVSIEQHSRSIDYKVTNFPEKISLVFGNEVDGISKDILEMSDESVEIPMTGKKESFNVSVTVGIILSEVL